MMNEAEVRTALKELAVAERMRRIALHESGHACVGELVGWRVRDVRVEAGVGGLCRFRSPKPAPWVEVVVSAAGHAAEFALLGDDDLPSVPDRKSAASAFGVGGLDELNAAVAALEVEEEFVLLFTDRDVRRMVRRVAKLLVRKGYLNRRDFLRAAGDDVFEIELRQRVRRSCRAVVSECLDFHLAGGPA